MYNHPDYMLHVIHSTFIYHKMQILHTNLTTLYIHVCTAKTCTCTCIVTTPTTALISKKALTCSYHNYYFLYRYIIKSTIYVSLITNTHIKRSPYNTHVRYMYLSLSLTVNVFFLWSGQIMA